jgi:hypothetical protein
MRSTWKNSLLALALGAPTVAQAGWPFTAEGPRRGSPEWYEMHAGDPIGQRQKFKFGKTWPAVPRPIGEPTPLIHSLHHNLYWPHPYVGMDLQSVEQYKFTQVARGWEQATTLFDYHFENGGDQLNNAGRDHLYWIQASVPPEFRVAYVQVSRDDPSISSQRLANVQAAAANFAGGQNMLPVSLRIATTPGTPAQDVDAVFQYRRDNPSPAPVLGESGGGGGGGDSGGM